MRVLEKRYETIQIQRLSNLRKQYKDDNQDAFWKKHKLGKE
jgi:hypothetical protein